MKKAKDETKSIRKPYNTLIMFVIIYFFMIVISIIDRVNILKQLSTTKITFSLLLSEYWFPIIVVILLVLDIFAYRKKELYGVLVEFSISLSMVTNIIVNSILSGFNFGMIVLPTILSIHSLYIFLKLKKQKSA